MAAQTFHVDLPASFSAVPGLGTQAFEKWTSAMSDRPADLSAGSTMSSDLVRLKAAISERPEASWMVVTGGAPNHHGIAAMAWLTAVPLPPNLTADHLKTLAEAPPAPAGGSVLRSNVTLHGDERRTIVVDHILQGVVWSGDLDADRLVERCSAIMIDDEMSVAVSFEMAAFDVRAFEDAVATAAQVLQSVRIAGDTT